MNHNIIFENIRIRMLKVTNYRKLVRKFMVGAIVGVGGEQERMMLDGRGILA